MHEQMPKINEFEEKVINLDNRKTNKKPVRSGVEQFTIQVVRSEKEK